MSRTVRPVVVPAHAIALFMVLVAATNCARADDFIVYSPYVTAGKREVEMRGYHYSDGRRDLGGSAAELSVSYTVNDWWKPELYLAEYQKTPADGGRIVGWEFENTFQLTPQGKYWADLGLVASYERRIVANLPDAIEVGPLIGMTSGRFAHVVNFIWEKQVGRGASGAYAHRYSYSGTYAVTRAFRPGVEAYGRPADHAYQAGPVVAGEWHLPGTASNFEYRVGVVLGINAAAPRQTWLAQFAYEFY